MNSTLLYGMIAIVLVVAVAGLISASAFTAPTSGGEISREELKERYQCDDVQGDPNVDLVFVNCKNPPEARPSLPPADPTMPITDSGAFVDALQRQGATVELTSEIEQPFFSVQGIVYTVNGDEVQVFEYADTTTAEEEASRVSPDGNPIGTTMVTWVASPHFYKTGPIIVLYVGDNQDIIRLLETVAGPPFAGQ